MIGKSMRENQQFSEYSNTTFGINPSLIMKQNKFIKYGFFANVSNTFLENKLDVSFGLD
jgi:hypothetical protein